ncbi:MAG: peptidyl-alpha-hydroxyglycine alpha-amidating lyase family protein [Betaproteobacteria bacterium]
MSELYVGLGERRFRVERPWAILPPPLEFGWITDVAVDSVSRVYVLQRYDPLVDKMGPVMSVFDPQGKYLESWDSHLIKDAHHVYISPDDRVFIVDRDAHQVVICDTRGEVTSTLGMRDQPNSPFNHPTSVAVGSRGDIYVADGYGASRVHRFAPDGQLVSTWGLPGRGPGEFTTPHGIWVLRDGRVLVGDRENDRVQIFDPEGCYLSELTGFFHPMSICADSSQTIYVSDQIPRLTAMSTDGTLLGVCRPVLNWAHGLAVDTVGNFYLSESRPNRITRLTVVS